MKLSLILSLLLFAGGCSSEADSKKDLPKEEPKEEIKWLKCLEIDKARQKENQEEIFYISIKESTRYKEREMCLYRYFKKVYSDETINDFKSSLTKNYGPLCKYFTQGENDELRPYSDPYRSIRIRLGYPTVFSSSSSYTDYVFDREDLILKKHLEKKYDYPEAFSCEFSSLKDKETLTKEFESRADAREKVQEEYRKLQSEEADKKNKI